MRINRVVTIPTLSNDDGIYYVNSIDGEKSIYILSSFTGEKVLTKVADSENSRWEIDDILYVVTDYRWNDIDLGLLPTGHRAANGAYSDLNYHGYFWSNDLQVYFDKLVNQVEPIERQGGCNQGASVRLFRPCTTEELELGEGYIFNNIYIDVDGNDYNGIKVNTKIFLTSNLKVLHYIDLAPIAIISDNALWELDTEGALAIYPNTDEVFYNQYCLYRDLYDKNSEWTIPLGIEWNNLIDYMNGNIVEEIDPNPTRIKPKDNKFIDARYIVNFPNYDGMYEPRDSNIQAHIIEIGNPHNNTAELVGAVRKNNPITAGTHSKIQYDEKGLVIGGSNIVTDDISDAGQTNKFVTQGFIDNSHAPNSDDQDLSPYQLITDNNLNTVYKTIAGAINETNAIARGKSRGLVFNTKASLDIWLTTPANKASLNNGDNLFITALDTPDYWWDYADQIYHPLEGEKVDTTIPNKAVTFEKIQDIPYQSFLGRNTSGNGSPETIALADVKTMLGLSIVPIGTIITSETILDQTIVIDTYAVALISSVGVTASLVGSTTFSLEVLELQPNPIPSAIFPCIVTQVIYVTSSITKKGTYSRTVTYNGVSYSNSGFIFNSEDSSNYLKKTTNETKAGKLITSNYGEWITTKLGLDNKLMTDTPLTMYAFGTCINPTAISISGNVVSSEELAIIFGGVYQGGKTIISSFTVYSEYVENRVSANSYYKQRAYSIVNSGWYYRIYNISGSTWSVWSRDSDSTKVNIADRNVLISSISVPAPTITEGVLQLNFLEDLLKNKITTLLSSFGIGALVNPPDSGVNTIKTFVLINGSVSDQPIAFNNIDQVVNNYTYKLIYMKDTSVLTTIPAGKTLEISYEFVWISSSVCNINIIYLIQF